MPLRSTPSLILGIIVESSTGIIYNDFELSKENSRRAIDNEKKTMGEEGG